MRARREARKRAKLMDVGGSAGNVNGDIGEDELARGKRKSKKCFCLARIYASLSSDGLWVLKTVHLEHTHILAPSMANLVKEYRMKKMTSTVRKRLVNFYGEGVSVSQIRGCLGTENKNLPNVKDMQHGVYKHRRLKMAGGDAQTMMDYFDYMQADNQNFYHVHRLDKKGRLKDVLWVDARSRVAYEEFGDVVYFDSTYLTNKYELPFANFVGVNHHGQSILLGCALISHEDSDTFRWIFHQWLACMGNRAPGAILTDQAAAMRKPLAEIMPNTRHRWCIWHILRKFPERLGSCALYKKFKNPLKELYKLEDNEWLQELFIERHMWIPAYMKEYFWAGMKTTHRVESINRFFDGFVTRKTKLCEFPEKYCKAMKKRTSDEIDADARDSKYIRRLVNGFRAEKVWIVPEGASEEIITERRRFYSLVFNPITKDTTCDCRKFEKDGILCKHIIRVWDDNKVKDIPSKCVLDRWRKDIPRRHTRVKVAYHDPSETKECKRWNSLIHDLEAMCDEALAVDDDTVEAVRTAVSKIRAEIRVRRAKHLAANAPTECSAFPCSEIGSSNPQPGPSSTPKLVSKAAIPESGTNHKPSASVISDPLCPKRRRGRPKGSKNKSPAELGSTPMPVNEPDQPPKPGTGTHQSHTHGEGNENSAFVIHEPVGLERRRGRPKGSKNKTLAELGSTPITKHVSESPQQVLMPDTGTDNSACVIHDPVTAKRPRGLPKGSRHKTLAELGYNHSKLKAAKASKPGVVTRQTTENFTGQASKLPRKRKTRQNPYAEFNTATNDAERDEFDPWGATEEGLTEHWYESPND
ncbi:protein FAR1-RELATED SEQUENCE 6-like [Chenopodium quinoa]|uniref:protein FAR1-RELATED SEQUENCE 6-like n=1 Tax=Chenopodium quinoa TaxID=63459 RepID=UPI000B76DD56|nr:protein FAR1-RELATED SEQUENCE 6-like [Chenopodium quinoa]